MTSSDVEIFRSGIEDLKYYIDGRFSEVDRQFQEVRAELRTVHENVLVNTAKIDAQRDFMGIGFTIMAVVIALIGFIVTLAPMFREMYKDAKRGKMSNASEDTTLTVEKIQYMIDISIAEALRNQPQNKGYRDA